MKIGIIVFSRTGNTLSVAGKLQSALLAKGHEAAVLRVRASNENPNDRQPVTLVSVPDPTKFDTLMFASPVEGFAISRITKVYLKQLPSLAGKRVYCFVTQGFPKAWLGGNRSIKQMSALCACRGGKVEKTAVISWSPKIREEQIASAVNHLSDI